MKKKFLIITLHDGSTIERDLTLEKVPGLPIGADANDPAYLQLCLFYLQMGITDKNSNENELTLICPSQFKTIQVKFLPAA